MNYKDKIKKLLNALPYELKIEFALYCAKDARQYANKNYFIDEVINLIYKRLKKESVTNKELKDAANAANAAYAAAYAAANAANAAAYAAANAAANAANAANAGVYEEKIKSYYNYLKILIKRLSNLEKIVYGLDP